MNFLLKKKTFNFQSSSSLEPIISDPGEGPGTGRGQGRRGQAGGQQVTARGWGGQEVTRGHGRTFDLSGIESAESKAEGLRVCYLLNMVLIAIDFIYVHDIFFSTSPYLSNAESWIPWFFFTNILWNCESKFHLNIHFLQPGLFYITCGVLCVFADLCQQDIARRPTHLALKMMDFQPGIMLSLIEPTESQPGVHHNQQGATPQPSVCVAICGNAQWTCVCHIVSCVHYLIYCCKVIDVFLWQLNGCESTVM